MIACQYLEVAQMAGTDDIEEILTCSFIVELFKDDELCLNGTSLFEKEWGNCTDPADKKDSDEDEK